MGFYSRKETGWLLPLFALVKKSLILRSSDRIFSHPFCYVFEAAHRCNFTVLFFFSPFGYPRLHAEVIQGWHFQKDLFVPSEVCCMRPLLTHPNPTAKIPGAQSSLHIIIENKARALRKISSSFSLIQAWLNWYNQFICSGFENRHLSLMCIKSNSQYPQPE